MKKTVFYVNTLHTVMLLPLWTLKKANYQGLIFLSDEYSDLPSATLMSQKVGEQIRAKLSLQ